MRANEIGKVEQPTISVDQIADVIIGRFHTSGRLLPAGLPPKELVPLAGADLFTSAPGTGKTSSCAELAKRLAELAGRPVGYAYLSGSSASFSALAGLTTITPAEDIPGLSDHPEIKSDTNVSRTTLPALLADIYKQVMQGCDEGVLVIDEWAALPPSEQRALIAGIGERSFTGFPLPDGWAVIMLSNRQQDKTGVKPLAGNTQNKICHWEISSGPKPMLAWMKRQRFHSGWCSALEQIADEILAKEVPFPVRPYATSRSLTAAYEYMEAAARVRWANQRSLRGEQTDTVSELDMMDQRGDTAKWFTPDSETEKALQNATIAGMIGAAEAVALLTSIGNVGAIPSKSDILESPDTCSAPSMTEYGMSLLVAEQVGLMAIEAATFGLEDDLEAIGTYLGRCPEPMHRAFLEIIYDEMEDRVRKGTYISSSQRTGDIGLMNYLTQNSEVIRGLVTRRDAELDRRKLEASRPSACSFPSSDEFI